MAVNKIIKNGDTIEFDNPIIVDEDQLRTYINESENTSGFSLSLGIRLLDKTYKYYSIGINKNEEDENYDKYITKGSITFSDDNGEEGEIVLQRDRFYSNLITGFKWNVDSTATIENIRSDNALRYTTMKFVYTQEIEKLKGIISDSGQIEKTIDFSNKWTTLNQLVNYARSLMVQNSNVVNKVQLEYDKNPNLRIGDIVDIQLSSFYTEGNFAVKEIDYTYKNEIEQNWKITLKSADLISTYIDIFRPNETEETQDKIDTVILSEFIEEKIKEIHTVSLTNEDNYTLNFNL